jgi:pentapeptide repeat protein
LSRGRVVRGFSFAWYKPSLPTLCAASLNAAGPHDASGEPGGVQGVGANLAAADLREADLAGANLTAARDNSASQWPCGFDPHLHGAVRVG